MSDILTAEGYEQTKEKLRPGRPVCEVVALASAASFGLVLKLLFG